MGEDILKVKLVVINTLVDLQKNQAEELKSALANLFTTPIILFNNAYDNFLERISGDSQCYDNWLNLQFQVITDLGPDRKRIVKEACELVMSIVNDTPGGDTGDFTLVDSKSYQVALLIRVYAGDIKFNEMPPEDNSKTTEPEKPIQAKT